MIKALAKTFGALIGLAVLAVVGYYVLLYGVVIALVLIANWLN